MSNPAAIDHPGVRRDVPLAPFTTYKRGGPARWFLEVATAADLDGLVVPEDMPILVLGRGSNLVVAEAGFDGLVLRLGADFARIEVEPDGTVVAGGAAPLPKVARAAAAAGRGGLAWLVGVPGSIGGAVAMNAGCFGADTAETLRWAEIVDLRTGVRRRATPADLDHGYRHSNLAADELVTEAAFATTPSTREAEEAAMREVTRWRRDHQPGGTHNAGSVFKNPPGDAAGRIIDELGLKGLSIGGASVSERHANFIVAADAATADDVHALMCEVRDRVATATGIELVPEIRFVGFADAAPGGRR
ncbi:MAG: UDP-N-acetylmuramate dehydrogenase [Acidimicrobiia bacterium]